MKEEKTRRDTPYSHTRRRILQRLGIAAGVIYAAPVLTGLSQGRASTASFSSFSGVRQQRARRAPEIVVTAVDETVIEQIEAQGYGLLARDRLEEIGADIARFTLPANRTLEEARAEILQIAPAALMDPNHLYRPDEFVCDDDGCMAFDLIGWTPTPLSCQSGVAVGMIDTGVNTDHEALSGVEVEQFAIAGPDRPSSTKMHGTAIAVLLAGRAESRTPGLLPGARLIAADAFHKDASGQDVADAFDVARALDRIAVRNVNVVNLSFSGPANLVLESVMQALLDRDVSLVAAAGNSGPNADPLFPAAYEGVVAVTAVDRHLKPYRQAASGEHIDFAAPGVRLWTAASIRGGRFRSGTSYAAPFVSAALAALRATEPGFSRAEAVKQLAARATDLGVAGRDETFGWGLVQAPDACTHSSSKILPAGGT